MNHRVLTSLGVRPWRRARRRTVWRRQHAAAQAQKAASDASCRQAGSKAVEKPWTVARTPDGVPDLQGYWTNNSYTPLERPNGVTKEFYTLQELRAGRKEERRTRRRADHARHGRRRALRLHAIRPGPQPDQAHRQPAHIGDHEPGERKASSGDARGPEESRRSSGRATEAGGPIRSGPEHPDRVALRLHERRARR